MNQQSNDTKVTQLPAAPASSRYRRLAQSSLLWASPFFLLAVIIGFKGLSSDRAWPVAALLLVGLLIAVVPASTWKEILSSVENAKFGPVSIALQRDLKTAAGNAPESDAGEGTTEPKGGDAQTMDDLRLRLEAKMTYVAKHLLASSSENATFLTVGSLNYDGYLTDVEARTALGILGTRQEELDELPDDAQTEFLEKAGRFVDSVRASIFWGQVKNRLLAKDGQPGPSLFIREMPSQGRRDDILAGQADAPVRVAPAFVVDPGSSILEQVITRLAGEGSAAAEGKERQIIVIPDHSKESEAEANDSAPRIVKLESLREELLKPS